MFNLKRIISGMVASCILITTLTACGTEKENESKGDLTGRYVETSITKDMGVINDILSIKRNEDNTLTFYSIANKQIMRNIVSKDNSVSSEQVKWNLQNKDIVDIAELKDGTIYILARQDENFEVLKTDINNEEYQVLLTNADWPDSPYETIDKDSPVAIYPAENGFILVFSTQVQYRDVTGSLINTMDGFIYLNANDVSTYGNLLLIRDTQTDTFLRYDLSTGNKLGENKYDQEYLNSASTITDDTIYFADNSGIYRQAFDGTKWENIVSGDGNSMGAPANTVTAVIPADEDEYYVCLTSMTNAKIVYYKYSETTVPQEEITIYSLTDYPILHQAISEFQAQNSNVKVTLNVPEIDSSKSEDIIRALNTEILNGKGPDIIVLDGLPAESYIEKGVLKDLSEFKNFDLLDKLLSTQKDNIYSIPTQVIVPVMISKDSNLQPNNMSDLIEKIKNNTDTKPYLYIPDNLNYESGSFFMEWYTRCSDNAISNKSIDIEKLTTLFEQIKELSDLLKADSTKYNIQRDGVLAEPDETVEVVDGGFIALKNDECNTHITNVTGQGRLSTIMNIFENEQYNIQSLFKENKFITQCNIGILKNSDKQEYAKEFLNVLFGESVQSAYVGTGLPVNKTALQNIVTSMLSDENGNVNNMGNEFLSICNKLDTPITQDLVIRNAVMAQSNNILNGSISPNNAAKTISDDVKLYLAE